jgi:amylosucrase
VFAGLRQLAAVRATLPHLHAAVTRDVLEPSDPGVLAVVHRHPEGELLQLYNVTDSWRPWPGERLGSATLRDALTDEVVAPGPDGAVWLAPYQARWLTTP